MTTVICSLRSNCRVGFSFKKCFSMNCANYFAGYLNENFSAFTGTTPAGFYSTPSTMTPGMPGPLLRLKTGTESATPSVNGVIARNLLRLGALLEDEEYRTLARQTCRSFSVEILQHPFLFVGLLDAVVGLETGTRHVTGVYSTPDITTSSSGQEHEPLANRANEPVSARDLVAKQARKEAGLTASTTSTTTVALVDIRPSHAGDFVGNPSFWLRTRNTMYKELKPTEPGKNYLMICEAGHCRMVDV